MKGVLTLIASVVAFAVIFGTVLSVYRICENAPHLCMVKK